MMDDAAKMSVLTSVRRRSAVELVVFTSLLALSLSLDRDFATVGLGVALAISTYRYQTATRRIEKIGFN